MTDKGELLRTYLEARGLQLRPTLGPQQVSCINEAGHARGDRRPSASVRLGKGRYKCFSCGLSGDVYDLLQELEGLTFKQARATLGVDNSPRAPEPETWI